jgi:hypothetical protein
MKLEIHRHDLIHLMGERATHLIKPCCSTLALACHGLPTLNPAYVSAASASMEPATEVKMMNGSIDPAAYKVVTGLSNPVVAAQWRPPAWIPTSTPPSW